MTPYRRDWRTEIDSIQKEMDRLLNHYAGSKPPLIQFAKRAWEPTVDVFETEDMVVIVVDLAGIYEEQLQILADRKTIAIRGERINPGLGTRRSYHQMEINSGPFERIISLPMTIDASKATATYQQGMLEIIAPKSKKRPTTKAYVRILNTRGTGDDQ